MCKQAITFKNDGRLKLVHFITKTWGQVFAKCFSNVGVLQQKGQLSVELVNLYAWLV